MKNFYVIDIHDKVFAIEMEHVICNVHLQGRKRKYTQFIVYEIQMIDVRFISFMLSQV